MSAGWLTDAVFEKNGKQIPYRKVSLTRAAYSINETTPIEFIMKETAVPVKRNGKRRVALAAKRKRAKRPETPARPKLGVPGPTIRSWLGFSYRGSSARLAFGRGQTTRCAGVPHPQRSGVESHGHPAP